MIRMVAASVSAAVLVAGCGGSGSLSGDQLRSRATALCSSAGRQTDRIPTPSAPGGGESFLKQGIAALTPELKGLRKLRAPSDLAQVYSTGVGAFTQKLNALKTAVRQLDSGASPVTAMTDLQQRLAPIETAEDGAWQALEVPACMNHPPSRS
jgi:hypothetical protein